MIQEDAPANTMKFSPDRPNEVLAMLYKKSTNEGIDDAQGADVITDQPSDHHPSDIHSDQTSATAIHPIPYSSMSVPELRSLLKDKYKKTPEKHAEIQKLKKAELIYALQQT